MSAVIDHIRLAIHDADVCGDADADYAAARIVRALEQAGYVTVPVVPTAAMWAAVNIVEPVGSGRNRVINLVSAEGWRAMLAAARLAE